MQSCHTLYLALTETTDIASVKIKKRYSAIYPAKVNDSCLVQIELMLVRPLPEGLCQPLTPPRWPCQEDAQPASPWTQSENPAHCCCDRWGGHWFHLPQRPGLRGGTSHLKNWLSGINTCRHNNCDIFLLKTSTCDVEVCFDRIQYWGPWSSTHSHSAHRGLWKI